MLWRLLTTTQFGQVSQLRGLALVVLAVIVLAAGFDAILSPEERWDAINYVRTVAAAAQADVLGSLPTKDALLVAPDFAIDTGAAAGETLREQRGRAVIHLVVAAPPERRSVWPNSAASPPSSHAPAVVSSSRLSARAPYDGPPREAR